MKTISDYIKSGKLFDSTRCVFSVWGLCNQELYITNTEYYSQCRCHQNDLHDREQCAFCGAPSNMKPHAYRSNRTYTYADQWTNDIYFCDDCEMEYQKHKGLRKIEKHCNKLGLK